ncbi:DUF3696 domain-containing protein [Streptosporangium oxazolinicum]|uniref:DUF3696 domain-containing protein n=1 Tax=Streptosporangium oxazolinicum TaxID=909287 RepID=A0ABP8AES4_9ACTN
MINKLSITNFKVFTSAEISLGKYTLLSGLNSSGKSTALQALALLRQAKDEGLLHHPEDHEKGLSGIPLNGDLITLGRGQDVLNEYFAGAAGSEPKIGFELHAGDVSQNWWVGYGRENDLLPIVDTNSTEIENLDTEKLFTIFNPGFQYLTADRITPAVTFPRSHEMAVRKGFLGIHGEYTIDFLRAMQDEPVSNSVLHHHAATSSRLLDQVIAWMQVICPGVRLQTSTIEGTDLIRLGFQFSRANEPSSRYYRPTNVGFGLTYVLPTVVACLSALPGSMILLENPEAHVHPRGQTALARLTCAAAAAGAQVIVETHSDHILNGVRLSVKEALLAPHDVALHYFQRGPQGVEDIMPAVGQDGMLSSWPSGFFDEWDRSLDELLD